MYICSNWIVLPVYVWAGVVLKERKDSPSSEQHCLPMSNDFFIETFVCEVYCVTERIYTAWQMLGRWNVLWEWLTRELLLRNTRLSSHCIAGRDRYDRFEDTGSELCVSTYRFLSEVNSSIVSLYILCVCVFDCSERERPAKRSVFRGLDQIEANHLREE